MQIWKSGFEDESEMNASPWERKLDQGRDGKAERSADKSQGTKSGANRNKGPVMRDHIMRIQRSDGNEKSNQS